MDNKEILDTNVSENVEPTTEQIGEQVIETPVKTYTNEEVDAIVGKKLARNEAKIRKEYERKYGELESVLKAGTGKEDLGEITDTYRSFYQGKGIQIPTTPTYSDKDIEVLAKAEADEYINSSFEEVVEEVDRLAALGQKMNPREQAVFRQLAEYRQRTERANELAKIGVTEDVYNSKEFNDFSAKFIHTTPVSEIYSIYNKMQPRNEVHSMGSMKNTSPANGVKEFYSRDEAMKFSREDFDKNPQLFKAVERSMLKW